MGEALGYFFGVLSGVAVLIGAYGISQGWSDIEVIRNFLFALVLAVWQVNQQLEDVISKA